MGDVDLMDAVPDPATERELARRGFLRLATYPEHVWVRRFEPASVVVYLKPTYTIDVVTGDDGPSRIVVSDEASWAGLQKALAEAFDVMLLLTAEPES